MKSDQRSKRRFAWVLLRVLPASVLATLVICLIISLIAKDVLRSQIHDQLNQQADSLASATQVNIDTLLEATRALAANQLLVSGLVDTVGRDNYLPAFFRSLRLPGPAGATISLTDYRGRIVASTGGVSSYETEPWIARVIADREYFDLSAHGVVMAVPVKIRRVVRRDCCRAIPRRQGGAIPKSPFNRRCYGGCEQRRLGLAHH